MPPSIRRRLASVGPAAGTGAVLGLALFAVDQGLELALGEPPIPAWLVGRVIVAHVVPGALAGGALGLAGVTGWRLVGGLSLLLAAWIGGGRLALMVPAGLAGPLVGVGVLGALVGVVAASMRLDRDRDRERERERVVQWERFAAAALAVGVPLGALGNLVLAGSPLSGRALAIDLVVVLIAAGVGKLATRVPGWALLAAPIALLALPLAVPSPGPAAVPEDAVPRDGRPPILLVLVDTLRADALTPGVAPALTRLASRSYVYTNAQSAAPWTIPAVASILDGVLPGRHGAGLHDGVFSGPSAPSLVEDLDRAGYETGALVANGWWRGFAGLDRGFRTFDATATGYTPLLLHPADQLGWDALPERRHVPGDVQTGRAVAWTQQAGDGPWFLLVHYMDPHTPWLPAVPPASDAPEDVYRACVRSADAAIGRLVDAAPDDAWIVVVADHGEEIGDHPGAYPDVAHPDDVGHGHTLYQELVHVPLIVRPPHGTSPRTIDRVVRSYDVLPTLLAAVGVDVPEGLDGRPLQEVLGLPADGDRVAPSEAMLYGPPRRAVRVGKDKLIAGPDRVELYDLAADPGERKTRDDADVVGRLAPLLPADVPRTQVRPVDARTQEALRAIGYLP